MTLEHSVNNPHDTQQKVLGQLLETTKDTFYGKKFHFKDISNYRQFTEQVPLNSYEDLFPYIELILKGEQNVLWPTTIKWFAKSSGTTGATSKIIPVSTEGLEQCHYQGGRDMLALYIRNYPDAKLFSGKNLSIGGSQEANFTGKNEYYTANISAIVMKNLPFWAQFGRTPGLGCYHDEQLGREDQKNCRNHLSAKVTSLGRFPNVDVTIATTYH